MGYSLEVSWRGASNEYQQRMVLSRNKKNIYLIPTYLDLLVKDAPIFRVNAVSLTAKYVKMRSMKHHVLLSTK